MTRDRSADVALQVVLKRWVNASGKTVHDLARDANVSPPQLRRLMAAPDAGEWTLPEIHGLANALGTKVSTLLEEAVAEIG